MFGSYLNWNFLLQSLILQFFFLPLNYYVILKSSNLQNSESSPKIKNILKVSSFLKCFLTFFSATKKKYDKILSLLRTLYYNCIYNLIKNDDLEIFKISLSSKYHDLSSWFIIVRSNLFLSRKIFFSLQTLLLPFRNINSSNYAKESLHYQFDFLEEKNYLKIFYCVFYYDYICII